MIVAKVKAVKEYTTYNGKEETKRYKTLIDVEVPGIVFSPDGTTYEHGYTSQIPGSYPLNATLEIEAILLHKGDNFHSIIIQNDCYFYDVVVK